MMSQPRSRIVGAHLQKCIRCLAGVAHPVAIGIRPAVDLDDLGNAAEAGNLHNASWIFRKLWQTRKDRGVSSFRVHIGLMLKACQVAGDFPGAERWYKILAHKGLAADQECHARLAQAAMRCGGFKAASRFVERATVGGDARSYLIEAEKRYLASSSGATEEVPVFRWNVILGAAANLTDLEAIELWLGRAEKSAENIPDACAWGDRGFCPDAVVLGTVLTAAAKRGNLQCAESWFRRLEAAGAPASQFAFSAVISAAAKSGNVSAAEHWFRTSLKAGVQPDAFVYGALIDSTARRGGLEASERWFVKAVQSGVEPTLIMFSSLMKAAARGGNQAAAQAWFDEAARAGLEPDCMLFGSLMDGSARCGDMDSTLSWFFRACTAGIEPNEIMFGIIFKAARKQNDDEAAVGWHRRAASLGFELRRGKSSALPHDVNPSALLRSQRTKRIRRLNNQQSAPFRGEKNVATTGS